MKNQKLSEHLLLISKLKSLDGDSRFSIAAFQHAAHQISMIAEDIETVDLSTISGIGKSILYDATQFLKEGTSDRFFELTERHPVSALTMTVVDGIGPKRAVSLYEKGFSDYSELLFAAKKNQIEDKKLQEAVLASEFKAQGRIPYASAVSLADKVLSALSEVDGVITLSVAGSLRRKMESSKDVDIAACVSSDSVRDKLFQKLESLGSSFIGGDAKGSVKVLHSLSGDGRQVVSVGVDLWIGKPVHWGALLNHCTGSKEFNIKLRSLAKEKSMQVNEYGIFDASGDQLGGAEEMDLFRILNIPYVEPENRK
jgi:DNA polymerase (family 10)